MEGQVGRWASTVQGCHEQGIGGLGEPAGLGGRWSKEKSRCGRQPGEEEGQSVQDKGNTVGKGTQV